MKYLYEKKSIISIAFNLIELNSYLFHFAYDGFPRSRSCRADVFSVNSMTKRLWLKHEMTQKKGGNVQIC